MVVAGEGWHPGVVGIVASRLVERWHRPCVVAAIAEDGTAKGSGRSISAYDLHAGLGACAGLLTRFGGHRMAAGLELPADSLRGFGDALAAHAAAALTPEDLIPEERVDAVLPAGALGLGLAEAMESLGPFGMGNPQPTLLVPSARVEAVTGMGAERQHARFTLTSGGARARAVAFGSTPRALEACAGDGPCDVAFRLERNHWNGVVEPRVLLRAVGPSRAGRGALAGRRGAAVGGHPPRAGGRPRSSPGPAPGAPARAVLDRRGRGVAGVAGDLLTSGEPVLAVCADVARRRAGLEQLVAGMAPGGCLDAVSLEALARRPALAAGYTHLVALDPPPAAGGRELLAAAPASGFVHLAWGAPEAEFALAVWRAGLDLRPALTVGVPGAAGVRRLSRRRAGAAAARRRPLSPPRRRVRADGAGAAGAGPGRGGGGPRAAAAGDRLAAHRAGALARPTAPTRDGWTTPRPGWPAAPPRLHRVPARGVDSRPGRRHGVVHGAPRRGQDHHRPGAGGAAARAGAPGPVARRRRAAPRAVPRPGLQRRRTGPRTCAGRARWPAWWPRPGVVAVVSLISPYAADRAAVRARHAEHGAPFVEVFVSTPPEVCEQPRPQGPVGPGAGG